MMQDPLIPIQQGGNLSALSYAEDPITDEADTQKETEAIADALDLDVDQVEDEIIELEDGSVVVNYTETKKPSEDPEFYANLAEELDDGVLDDLAFEYLDLIEVDRESRSQRDKQYEEGIRRTGLGNDAPGGANFEGASKVVHPIMAEACVDFAANASRELLPADGLVKTEIRGLADTKKIEIAERKANFMNWQLTEQIEEYRDEMEQLFTQLPLGGSQYLKWRFDKDLNRPVPEWIPIDNLLLPFSSTNFYSASRITEQQDITEDMFKVRVESGEYRDIEIYTSDLNTDKQTKTEKANDKVEGKTEPTKNVDGVRRIYEVTCFLRLEDDLLTDGERAPYVMTIDETSGKVVGLYRNWEAGDKRRRKIDWIVEYKFIPWRGAYAIGMPHLIGGLSAALTGSLRALMDAAHINNSQTMLKLKGGRIGGQTDRIEPTQVVEIEGAPGVDDVRKLAMPMPFNAPSNVLFQLLGWLTDAAKGVVKTSEGRIAEAGNNMPVGTAQALIEQGSKVFSSIHARLHRSQAKSLQILSRLNYWYLEEMDNQSGQAVAVEDFEECSDISPVSDPNIFSETQRLTQAQAVLELATKSPQMYDMREANMRVLKLLKVPDIEKVLPNPKGTKESNPALENVQMTMGAQAAAYPDQEHLDHIKVHLAYMMDPAYGGNPVISNALLPLMMEHIKQHLTLHYLQSMRRYVSHAAGGEDAFKLNEERKLDKEAQEALAYAAQLVSQDSQQVFQPINPIIQQMAQQLQQAKQAMAQNAVMSDPTSQALIQTQMAETKRKGEEMQAKMQLEREKMQAEMADKVRDMEAKMAEIQAKLGLEQQMADQDNAARVAIADINNASKERVAMIAANAQMDQQQLTQQHQQNQTALEAEAQANADLRKHGLQQDQAEQQRAHEATMAAQQQLNQQAQQAEQQKHQAALQAMDQSHQAAMQAAQPTQGEQ
jgi:chaperonin GroES